MVELRKKLRAKRFSLDIVEAVIGDFKNRCISSIQNVTASIFIHQSLTVEDNYVRRSICKDTLL